MISSEDRGGFRLDEDEEFFESELHDTESMVYGGMENETSSHEEGAATNYGRTTTIISDKDHVQLLSEFGRLCSVRFFLVPSEQ